MCVCGCSQVGFAFRSVEHALTIIVTHLESFSGLAAETERLDALAAGRHTRTTTLCANGCYLNSAQLRERVADCATNCATLAALMSGKR